MKKRVASGLIVLALAWVLALAGPVFAQGDDKTPPQSYDEVAGRYQALVQDALALHEEAVALFLSGDMEALYARLTAEAQAEITPELLAQAHAQLIAAGPLGEQIDAHVLLISHTSKIVMALYPVGGTQVYLAGVFDAADQISGLWFDPVIALSPDPAADFVSPVSFRLPFDGLWYTGWGGPEALRNYHMGAAPQRHAYDFLVWKEGSTFATDGLANDDYYAYGQPVLSPADGVVVRVVNDLPDVLPQVETDGANPAGNHVVIRVAEDMYLYIAHMQPGSVLVAEGDTVTAGQMIGRVGNSGNTSEPHIHIHLQNTPEMFTYDESGLITGFTEAIGLPLVFSDIVINGEPVAAGVPLGGQFVQPDTR